MRSGARELWRAMRRDPMCLFGLILVLVTLSAALFAGFIAPYDPVKIDVANKFAGISAEHWLGTDHLGRDTLSRVIFGARVAMGIALSSILIAAGIGLFFGLLAGYGPRWLDNIILFIFDTLSSVPLILLALTIIAIAGAGTFTLVFVIIIVSVPTYGRLVRSQTLSLRRAEFILAEQSMGAGLLRILGVHLLPNVLGPLVIMVSMDIPTVVALEAALSYLGLGVKPPTPSWGAMLFDGYTNLRSSALPVIAAGLPLVIATLGFTFFGEALRDALDPKLKKGVM